MSQTVEQLNLFRVIVLHVEYGVDACQAQHVSDKRLRAQ
jgi:hypothetical protein